MEDDGAWKKPSDVMKRHRRRKSASQKRITGENRTNVIYKSPSKAVKRKNPFSRNAPEDNSSKDPRLDHRENVKGNVLFDILNSSEGVTNKGTGDQNKTGNQVYMIQQSDNQDSSTHQTERPIESSTHKPELTHVPSLTADHSSDPGLHPYLPLDLCLKTKLRVVSSKPLGWCTQLKSSDETAGVNNFVQDKPNKLEGPVEQKQAFQSCCMYWAHPNLPWVKLFPRITEASLVSKSYSLLLQEEVQKSLQADWELSFASAYHQLRSGLCPYFYLCTHQFTVLFHKGLDDQSRVCAMITPTTRGLREALENEGIAFRLPVDCRDPGVKGRRRQDGERNPGQSNDLLVSPRDQQYESKYAETCGDQSGNQSGNRSCSTEESGRPDNQSDLMGEQQEGRSEYMVKGVDDLVDSSFKGSTEDDKRDDGMEDDDEEAFEAHDAASGWLESIGLDKKEFPSLDPKKVKLQREGFRIIDNRPESLVFVEGANVQALYNFLLNCRACTASSGPQAGVPPTILSPTAFKGAVLKSHKVKHSVVKQPGHEGQFTHAHILELLGPVMPNHFQALTTLLHHTQAASFGMTFSNHQPTAAFNILADVSKTQAGGQANDCNRNCQGNSGCDSRDHSQTDGRQFDVGMDNSDTKFFRNMPIDNRVCAIKEFVCSPEGFQWTPT